MSADTFERQIEEAQRRLEALEKRAKGPADQRTLTVELVEDLSTALEELHVAAEELRQQNEELIAARQGIETERQRYHELFEFAPDGYLVTDCEGIIREANRVAALLFGVLPEFLAGKHLSVFVSEEDHPPFFEHLGRLQGATETLEDWQLTLRSRERGPFPSSVTVGVARDVAGRMTGLRWLVRDITERKRTEEELCSARDQLRALAAHQETSREKERSSIARESREELAQLLAALKIDLAWVADRVKGDDQASRTRVAGMLALLDTALKSALQIASESRPASLDDLGLIAAITWQAHEFQIRSGIRCHLTSNVRELELDRERRTAIFRIVQEVLTDVARQTGATSVSIELQVEAGRIVLAMTDDGKRIPEREIATGESLGLLSMRERAYPLGGDVSVVGLPDRGTRVILRIPLRLETGGPTAKRGIERQP